mmetsp:Transcript_17555/g.38011  ORF Transcript_17555/g.38011 Transcript_17555/m.38011 type:complete len:89 (-) Transcript_17555:625-891(-)
MDASPSSPHRTKMLLESLWYWLWVHLDDIAPPTAQFAFTLHPNSWIKGGLYRYMNLLLYFLAMFSRWVIFIDCRNTTASQRFKTRSIA